MDMLIWQRLHEKQLKVARGLWREATNAPYLPLALPALMVGEVTPFQLCLKVKEARGGEVKFIPFLEAGELLQEGWIQTFENLGIDRLYVHRRDLDRVVAYLNNHLLLLSDTGDHPAEKLLILREHLQFSLQRAFAAPKLGQHIKAARKVLQEFLLFLEKGVSPWRFINDILYHDYSLYNHSINVSLLGLGFMVFFQKTRQECLVMGLAGLFHDLGLTRLDEAILYKVEPLTQKEWDLIKRHPLISYTLLKDYNGFPPESRQLVLEHQENADGSGYPQGLRLYQQHPLTRIIRVVDAYDSLTCHKAYRPAHKPFSALKLMQEQKGENGPIFDTPTLKNFIRFLAII